MKNAKIVFYASVMWILYGTLGCSATNDLDKNGDVYQGRSFMTEILLTANLTNIRSGDTLQLQSLIDTTEFEVHGRWVLFSTDTLNCIMPTAELYQWNPDGLISERDSTTNPLERYSLFRDTEYSHDNPFEQLRYSVAYAFPPIIFRRGESLTSQFMIVYPGKVRPEFAYGDTSKVSLRMIFQIDSALIDKDTIWHANNTVYELLSNIGCEKRWYNINKYFTDRKLVVERIGWIYKSTYPDGWSFNYNITKNH